jgi:glutamate-1-semialdehyde 2,1-aminomutase
MLGHGYAAVVERVTEALTMGIVFAMTRKYEIEAAEKIKNLTGVDLVRYANSGTEATMHAIRIACAFTGRNKIIKAGIEKILHERRIPVLSRVRQPCPLWC